MKKIKIIIPIILIAVSITALFFGCSSVVPKQTTPTTTPVISPPVSEVTLPPSKIPAKSSPYTVAALENKITPYFMKGLKSTSHNTPLSQQVLIPKLVANVLTCEYFAYQDFAANIISLAQFNIAIANCSSAMDSLSKQFNTVNAIVVTYPQKNSAIGMSYFETIGSQKNWNTVNSVKAQQDMMKIATSINTTQNPKDILSAIQQCGVLLAQAKLYGTQNSADVSQITLSNFNLSWLLDNAYYTKSFVYAIIK